MTDKQKIKKVCTELGLQYARDYWLMYSDLHQRWEFWRSPKKTLYGSTTRAMIRAIRRLYRSKTKTTTAPVHEIIQQSP